MKEYRWRTIGLTVAAPGWRALYHDEDEPAKPTVSDLVGWALEESYEVNSHGKYISDNGAPRETRLVPVGVEIDSEDNRRYFWKIIGPSDVMPSKDECAKACAEYLKYLDSAEPGPGVMAVVRRGMKLMAARRARRQKREAAKLKGTAAA